MDRGPRQETATTIDYFATSLPDFLVFDNDGTRRRDRDCAVLLGIACRGLQQASDARDHFTRALSLDPTCLDAKWHLEELASRSPGGRVMMENRSSIESAWIFPDPWVAALDPADRGLRTNNGGAGTRMVVGRPVAWHHRNQPIRIAQRPCNPPSPQSAAAL